MDGNEETPLICHFLNSFVLKIERFYQKSASKKAPNKAKIAKTVEEFFEGIPATCRDANGGTSINWARAFNRRMLFTKKFIPSETLEFIEAAITAYTEYAEDSAKRGTPQGCNSTFVDFKTYFESHSVDVENSLLGVHMSKALINKCLQHTQNPSEIQPGTLVAIQAGGQDPAVELAFSDHIFARAVTGLLQDGNVGVTTDPCEKGGSFMVPGNTVLMLSEDQGKRINSRCRVEEIVAIPLQNIVNEFAPLVNSKIEEDVSDFLEDNKYFYVEVDKVLNPAESLTFDSMPVLEALVGWFKQTLSDESFTEDMLLSVDAKWDTLKQDLFVNLIIFHDPKIFISNVYFQIFVLIIDSNTHLKYFISNVPNVYSIIQILI